MLAEAWIRSRVSASGTPGMRDHDVAAGLGGDLGFGDTGAVHALADDLHGLVQLLLRDRGAALHCGRQDHLGAALEVKGKLGGQAGVLRIEHAA